MKIRLRDKTFARSTVGDVTLLIFLTAGAAFMSLPLVYTISNAFKPLNELFIFPPQFFVRNPTLGNFYDLFALMGKSWVPMSRYLFNSAFIVAAGIAGNLLCTSLAAYALSKHDFFGQSLMNEIIVLSLMFAPAVTSISNYLTLSYLGFINTYAAIIIPSWASTLGLYLMKKFMDAMVHESLLEAARIEGATELQVYWRVVMPIIRPAWLTTIILLFQQLWGTTGGQFIYSEHLKTMPYALNQILKGGIARAGVGAAASVLMISVPIIVFVWNQSRIVETMGTSGID